MFNPYMTNMFPYPSNSPSPIEIPHVNGTNGAQAYQMPCNSSVLLLDDNAPIVYLVKTDSASTVVTIQNVGNAAILDVNVVVTKVC